MYQHRKFNNYRTLFLQSNGESESERAAFVWALLQALFLHGGKFDIHVSVVALVFKAQVLVQVHLPEELADRLLEGLAAPLSHQPLLAHALALLSASVASAHTTAVQ